MFQYLPGNAVNVNARKQPCVIVICEFLFDSSDNGMIHVTPKHRLENHINHRFGTRNQYRHSAKIRLTLTQVEIIGNSGVAI